MVLELLLLVTVWVLGLTAVHLVKPPPAPRLERAEPVNGQFTEHAHPFPSELVAHQAVLPGTTALSRCSGTAEYLTNVHRHDHTFAHRG